MSDDLVGWLRVQIDDDERIARAAAGLRPRWTAGGGVDETGPTKVLGEDGYVVVEDDTDWAAEIVTHIARQDPARVLREVGVKRRILDAYVWAVAHPNAGQGSAHPNAGQGNGYWVRKGETSILLDVLFFFAALYSDRPGYREEWKWRIVVDDL